LMVRPFRLSSCPVNLIIITLPAFPPFPRSVTPCHLSLQLNPYITMMRIHLITLALVSVSGTAFAMSPVPEQTWQYVVHYGKGMMKLKLDIPEVNVEGMQGATQINAGGKQWRAVSSLPDLDARLTSQPGRRSFTLHSEAGTAKTTVVGPGGPQKVSRGFPGGTAEFSRVCDHSTLDFSAASVFDHLSAEQLRNSSEIAWRSTPVEGMVITVVEDPTSHDMTGIMEYKHDMVHMVYPIEYEAVDVPETPKPDPEAGPTPVAKNATELVEWC